MLTRPQVVGPVSELTRAIRVKNQFAGAKVTIFATTFIPSIGYNARKLVTDTTASSDTRIDLPPDGFLLAGDELVAMQEFGGDLSPAPVLGMQLAVTVQRAPSASADLGYISFASTLWRCGQYLWLKGGFPGADGTVLVAGTSIGSASFFEAEGARFRLNEPLLVACFRLLR